MLPCFSFRRWKSCVLKNKQSMVTGSIVESKCGAMTQSKCIYHLLEEVVLKLILPTKLKCDN